MLAGTPQKLPERSVSAYRLPGAVARTIATNSAPSGSPPRPGTRPRPSPTRVQESFSAVTEPAVEDPTESAAAPLPRLGHDRTHMARTRLGVLGARRVAGPDRPDGLVSDHQAADLGTAEALERSGDLAGQDLLGLAGVALVLVLADADDRDHRVA